MAVLPGAICRTHGETEYYEFFDSPEGAAGVFLSICTVSKDRAKIMKIQSLNQNGQFHRLYRRGRSVVTPTMVVYALPNRQKTRRLGITAGKKVGGAVARNRAKRRIRELFRNAQPHLASNYDFCIVARGYTVHAPFEKLMQDFNTAMKKLEVWTDEVLHS